MGSFMIGLNLGIWGCVITLPFLLIGSAVLYAYTKRSEFSQPKEYFFFSEGIFLSGVGILLLTIQGLAGCYKDTSLAESIQYSNFIPLRFMIDDMKKCLDLDLRALVQIYGNIAMFVPFGFFLSYFLRERKNGFRKFYVSVFFLSGGIECIQFICGRACDVNDILLNVLGGLIGYYIFAYLHIVFGKFDCGQTINKTTNQNYIKKVGVSLFAIVITVRILIG